MPPTPGLPRRDLNWASRLRQFEVLRARCESEARRRLRLHGKSPETVRRERGSTDPSVQRVAGLGAFSVLRTEGVTRPLSWYALYPAHGVIFRGMVRALQGTGGKRGALIAR